MVNSNQNEKCIFHFTFIVIVVVVVVVECKHYSNNAIEAMTKETNSLAVRQENSNRFNEKRNHHFKSIQKILRENLLVIK